MLTLFQQGQCRHQLLRFPNESAVRICWREILPTRDCQKEKTKARTSPCGTGVPPVNHAQDARGTSAHTDRADFMTESGYTLPPKDISRKEGSMPNSKTAKSIFTSILTIAALILVVLGCKSLSIPAPR
jgi:hypothetical protein